MQSPLKYFSFQDLSNGLKIVQFAQWLWNMIFVQMVFTWACNNMFM
jgi:hypothetical protein